MDYFDKVAHQLIGIEVELSRRAKNLTPGYTTGKARIKRHLLKTKFGISSNLQLDSLKDALSELGYVLIDFDYQSDFFLINLKNFLINVRIIGAEEIDDLEEKSVEIAEQFFKAVEERNSNEEL